MNIMQRPFALVILSACCICLQACSSGHRITRLARHDLTQAAPFQNAHIGISIFDPASQLFLCNIQSDKYFIPASNTKLFSLYAGLKYLGDSLAGIRMREGDREILLFPTGDPTLLHPDFASQPVISLLKSRHLPLVVSPVNWQEIPLGPGWAWDDYNDDYMIERSSLPVYGNFIRWEQIGGQNGQGASPRIHAIPAGDWKTHISTDSPTARFMVQRKLDENSFEIRPGREAHKTQDVPFVTGGLSVAMQLLSDTIGEPVSLAAGKIPLADKGLQVIHSRPVDSMFRPMMHHSDNFFAEQTLLMVSNERLGLMNDEKIIDTLLKSDLAGLPQQPKWVDGSGLSRFNLFTPRDFVWLLTRMKDEFGLDRISRILPTGGTGTLGSRYKQDSGYIFAKTGSLTGVIALSGYLVTRSERVLIFSILVNNYNGSTASLRNAMAAFLHSLRKQY